MKISTFEFNFDYFGPLFEINGDIQTNFYLKELDILK
jgi:hypothetical protein